MTMDRSAHSRLAVTYRRISSLNQVDNNSMCAQEQAIKDYAKKNHLKIVEAFHDLAKSGTSVQNRTGLSANDGISGEASGSDLRAAPSP